MTITLTREEAFEIVEMIECMKLGHKYEGIAEIMSDLLRDRLAQPKQEPVAWMHIPHDDNLETVITKHKRSLKIYKSYVPLYTTPPQRDFKFSTTAEAKQPASTQAGEPKLTDDEMRFAHAFTALIKAGYGKEVEIVLKAKLPEKNG